MKARLVDGIFWSAVVLTTAHSYFAVDLGPTEEGGYALGRAFVCAAIGLIAYLISPEETL